LRATNGAQNCSRRWCRTGKRIRGCLCILITAVEGVDRLFGVSWMSSNYDRISSANTCMSLRLPSSPCSGRTWAGGMLRLHRRRCGVSCGREGIRSARHTRGNWPHRDSGTPLGLPGLPFGVAGWRVRRTQVWRGVRSTPIAKRRHAAPDALRMLGRPAGSARTPRCR
jgi:hypothetical protein